MDDVLNDPHIFRDVPLGMLHTIAVDMKIAPAAAKSVVKERLEFLARRAGFPAGARTGACGGRHNTTIGVKIDTAGTMYLYCRREVCSTTVLYEAPVDLKVLFSRDAWTIANANKLFHRRILLVNGMTPYNPQPYTDNNGGALLVANAVTPHQPPAQAVPFVANQMPAPQPVATVPWTPAPQPINPVNMAPTPQPTTTVPWELAPQPINIDDTTPAPRPVNPVITSASVRRRTAT
ncbi:hypothetical protein SCHPADRAFT_948003, partial [Schizopora paradoxa]